MRRGSRTADADRFDPISRASKFREQPLVGRVAAGIEDRQADNSMVCMVDVATLTSREVEVHSDNDLWSSASKNSGGVLAQIQVVLDRNVWMSQELHLADSDDDRGNTDFGHLRKSQGRSPVAGPGGA